MVKVCKYCNKRKTQPEEVVTFGITLHGSDGEEEQNVNWNQSLPTGTCEKCFLKRLRRLLDGIGSLMDVVLEGMIS